VSHRPGESPTNSKFLHGADRSQVAYPGRRREPLATRTIGPAGRIQSIGPSLPIPKRRYPHARKCLVS
jgi:hypothetical protein